MAKNLLMAIAFLHFAQATHAMCAATTQNLVLLDVNVCQRIKIHASDSKPPAHAIHKRGSSITGTLVTGKVIESTLVWDGDPATAEYIVESEKLALGETSSFFLMGNASKICPELIGTAATFITDPPCCDVLPADGFCLVPATLAIARIEKIPERWAVWDSPN